MKTDSLKEQVVKWILLVMVGVTFVAAWVTLWPIYNRMEALKHEDGSLDRQIEAKKREIAKLIEYRQRFKTDADFVEAIARQKRRVYPGELVFVFEN